MYDFRIWLSDVIIKFYIYIHVLSAVKFSMKFTVSNILLMFEPAQNYFKFGKFFELGISGIFPCRRMFIMFLL